MANKNPVGRPRGWTPGQTREPYSHQVGVWAWHHDRLLSKLVQGTPDECWAWRGAVSPAANLFGAYKNGRAQMTQTNRLLYMALHNKDIEGWGVYMTCGSKHCSNPHHFELLPTRQRNSRHEKNQHK